MTDINEKIKELRKVTKIEKNVKQKRRYDSQVRIWMIIYTLRKNKKY